MLFIRQLPSVFVSWRIDDIAKWADFSNYVARELKFGSLDGGEGDENNGVFLVKISQIFAIHGPFFCIQWWWELNVFLQLMLLAPH